MTARPNLPSRATVSNHEPLFDKKKIYSSKEAAEGLGVSEKTIRTWVYRGQLTAYRVGLRRLGFRGADLEAMLTVIPFADQC